MLFCRRHSNKTEGMSGTFGLNRSEFRLWLPSEQELQITIWTEMPISSLIWTWLAGRCLVFRLKAWCCNVLMLFSPLVIFIFLAFYRLTESSKSKICQYFYWQVCSLSSVIYTEEHRRQKAKNLIIVHQVKYVPFHLLVSGKIQNVIKKINVLLKK